MTTKTGVRVAIVTGGASGIGLALAQEMAAAGVHAVLADRQIDLARREALRITERGGSAAAAELDVRDRGGFQALVEATLADAGRLDYLFNNAGIGVVGEMRYFADRDWVDVIDVNLLGVANGVAAAYPVMIRQRSGHIINTASLAGLIAVPMIGSYTASKFAVVGLSKALRVEARRHGVRVSVICPGLVRHPSCTAARTAGSTAMRHTSRGSGPASSISPSNRASLPVVCFAGLRATRQSLSNLHGPGWSGRSIDWRRG